MDILLLTVHPNSASNSFLKIDYNAESKTVSINFSFSATLKCVWSILPFEWLFYTCMTLNIIHQSLGKQTYQHIPGVGALHTPAFPSEK